jgi:hypothetical protein
VIRCSNCKQKNRVQVRPGVICGACKSNLSDDILTVVKAALATRCCKEHIEINQDMILLINYVAVVAMKTAPPQGYN